MNNIDRSTRTLIVSFTIAIFALIPLRFVEAGKQMELIDTNYAINQNAQVLGETIEIEKEPKAVLEAPYNEIELSIPEEVEVEAEETVLE